MWRRGEEGKKETFFSFQLLNILNTDLNETSVRCQHFHFISVNFILFLISSAIPRRGHRQSEDGVPSLPRAFPSCRVHIPHRHQRVRLAVFRSQPRANLRAGPSEPPIGTASNGTSRHIWRGLGAQHTELYIQRESKHTSLREPPGACRDYARVPHESAEGFSARGAVLVPEDMRE